MYRGHSLQLERIGDFVELCFDRKTGSVNKFDAATIEELRNAIAELASMRQLRGVLVTSARTSFIVGADIFEFARLFARPRGDIEAYIHRCNEVFNSFEALPVPIVTAINGVALGGGFEQALLSDARVMASTAQVGLPEVGLGLIPGFGGTARLSRLIGACAAIEWIVAGKPHAAISALEIGVVNEVTVPESLRAAALDLLTRLAASGEWRSQRTMRLAGAPFSATSDVEAVRARLTRASSLQPVGLEVVELIERCAALNCHTAIAAETSLFARVAKTQAAASHLQLFISDQHIRAAARASAEGSRPVRKLAVLGAGIMGGGISYTSAAAGVSVYLSDIAPPALELGLREVKRQLDRQTQNGRMSPQQAASISAAIRPQLDYTDFEQADLIIEAVVEDLAVKRRVLSRVEAVTGPKAIIATNTSSLSVADLAASLQRPERFVGLHFFNPVPQMPLVEVIRSPDSSAAATAAAVAYALQLGKTPVVVNDGPGFLVNRILTAYLLGFHQALRDGADFQHVDRLMEEFGWPMGPAYLEDVIGMDTTLKVLEIVSAGFPTRMRFERPIAPLLLVEAGRLGQKNGRGYYHYELRSNGKRQKLPDPATQGLLAASVAPLPYELATRTLSDESLVDRLMLPMILEAARCLEENVAEGGPEAIDLALVLGLSFPRHAGGPLKYADWLGLPHVVSRCEALAFLGPLYTPTVQLREMAARGDTFFGKRN